MTAESPELSIDRQVAIAPMDEDVLLDRTSGRWIRNWQPEDESFWGSIGSVVAKRNLAFSIGTEFLGFCVWMLWSIVAVHLNDAGFNFSTDQLFWLVAVPGLVGAVLRLPYTFAVPRFGGRNWTIVSALLLLVPTLGLAWAVSNPETSFTVMLLVAATAGFGGGNFASSMSNISYFYPERKKGWALGLNAAGGNIGVAFVQAPIVISALIVAGGGLYLFRAGLVWIPLVLLAAYCAWRFMDNIVDAKADFSSSAAAACRGNTWIMSFLYVGTFGSFIGFAATFPLLIKTQFPSVSAVSLAFLGALLGSLARPLGGRLADRVGGAPVTIASFTAMGVGAMSAIWSLSIDSFPMFLCSFLLLFISTGVGNGSTYRMIPAIFRFGAEGNPAAMATARRQAAAAIGIISAVGALGGFMVPRTFAWSAGTFGSITPALWAYVCLYGVMVLLTWAAYVRAGSPMAKARV